MADFAKFIMAADKETFCFAGINSGLISPESFMSIGEPIIEFLQFLGFAQMVPSESRYHSSNSTYAFTSLTRLQTPQHEFWIKTLL